VCVCVCVSRRRRRELLIASQRLHHLHQYHTKGNPVGLGGCNGSVPATISHQPPTAAAAAAAAQPRRDDTAEPRREMDCSEQQQQQPCVQYSVQQRRSHINGDVFYLSGRAPPPPLPTVTDDQTDDVTTTFQYLTYDRDYFRERQKPSALHHPNLRHSAD